LGDRRGRGLSVAVPPGCQVVRWGGGSGGGVVLVALSSRVLLCAPTEAAAAALLGAWLTRELFDATPHGPKLTAGPTALVAALDMPLAAADQERPSSRADENGLR
jgi:hypothetical protein